MIKVGKINELEVVRETESGYYLSPVGVEEEAFLPPAIGPENISIGDVLKVFVYPDTSGSLLATTHLPKAQVGEYAVMKVVERTHFGAFCDWGDIGKDLLIPDTEQKEPIHTGEEHIVRVCIDEATEKVYGTTKLGKYIQSSEFDIEEGDKVELIPSIEQDLGFRCVVNKKFIGMIYHNEIFQEIELDKPLKGVVKKIREDGLVDCALQAQGIRNVANSREAILEYLEKVGGSSPLNDKSTPDDIKDALAMSKQTFKRAIGMLYKARKIKITKTGIELTK